jgi:hypothetical protein
MNAAFRMLDFLDYFEPLVELEAVVGLEIMFVSKLATEEIK